LTTDTLLYPHHNGLENEEGVHTWCRINGTRSVLDTASFDVAKGGNARERIGELLSETPPLNTEESAIREGVVVWR
jgi:5-methylcytosine-specific restriction enzyme subunit McrC